MRLAVMCPRLLIYLCCFFCRTGWCELNNWKIYKLKQLKTTYRKLASCILLAATQLHPQTDSILYIKRMIWLHNNGHKVLCVTRLLYWIQSDWKQYTGMAHCKHCTEPNAVVGHDILHINKLCDQYQLHYNWNNLF